LEREYQQHRNLDYYGLPETFAAWRDTAGALADQLSRVTGRRVVKVVIHPGELEEWARRTGRAVSAKMRSDFAETLWQDESAGSAAYTANLDFRVGLKPPGRSGVKFLQLAIDGSRPLA
jgi:hypothetical protein